MHIQIFAIPYDSARHRWRSGAGPEALLRRGLSEHLQSLGHVVARVHVIEDDPALPPAEIRTAFELARRLSVGVRAAHDAGHFALVLGGNCNTAVGTLSGLGPGRRGTFWFDAHGDFNTPETTETGYLDGMGLAMTVGLCWERMLATVPGFRPLEAEATFLLGVRDLDPPEAALLGRSAVTRVDVGEIPAGIPALLARADLADTVGYLHLDLDVLDPSVGQANDLPVAGGLSVAELTDAISAIRARIPVRAVAIASYSPEHDHEGGIARAAFAAIDAVLGNGTDPT